MANRIPEGDSTTKVPTHLAPEVQSTNQALTSLPHTSGADNPVQNETNQLLNKSGYARTNEGVAVRDVGPTGTQAADGLSTAENVYGTGETLLTPPSPPRIELNDNLRLGAESFANSIDLVFNNMLFKPSSQPAGATAPLVGEGFDYGQLEGMFNTANKMLFGGKLTVASTASGLEATLPAKAEVLAENGVVPTVTPSSTTDVTETASTPTPATPATPTTTETTVTDPTPNVGINDAGVLVNPQTGEPIVDPDVALSEVLPALLNILGPANETLRTQLLNGPTAEGDAQLNTVVNQLSDLNAEFLLAMFLKLNINDPNNSVETHNDLHQLTSTLRKQHIAEAQKRQKNAHEMLKEALASADKAAFIGQIVMIVMIIIMIILIVCTCGAALAAAPAVAGAATAATAGASAAATAAATSAAAAATAAGASTAAATAGATAAATAAGTAGATAASVGAAASTAVAGAGGGAAASAAAGAAASASFAGGSAAAASAAGSAAGATVAAGGSSAAASAAGSAAASAVTAGASPAAVGTAASEAVIANGGSSAAASAAGEAATASATQSATAASWASAAKTVRVGGSLVNGAGQVVHAAAENKAANKMADAKEAENDAERSRLMAEMMQKALEEESEIIKLIMESKNQTVDAVLKMMNAMFTTGNKIMSAGMAR